MTSETRELRAAVVAGLLTATVLSLAADRDMVLGALVGVICGVGAWGLLDPKTWQ